MLGVTSQVQNKKIHTWDDWKLKWFDVEISSPSPKSYTIDIPGMDGALDLTESLMGDVKYSNRKIKLNFELDGDYYSWATISSMINNFCHGQKAKVILDTDPNYYWEGRISLSSTKDDYSYGEVELTMDADAYKYEKYSSIENWLWDDFSFEDGIIREYKDLQVTGSMQLIIPGRRKKIYPYITCSNNMQVTFNGVTYNLPKGTVQALGIELGNTDNILYFSGYGTVSVEYRGGSL